MRRTYSILFRSLTRVIPAGVALALIMAMQVVANAQTSYTWNVNGAGSWGTAANWSPARTSPASNDILVVDGSVTPSPLIQNVVTQTIGRFVLTNGATLLLQSASSGMTLTIAGGTGTDLDIPSGTMLNTAGSNSPAISLGSGATGLVAGKMDEAVQLLATDAGSLVFAAGAVFTSHVAPGAHVFGSTSLNSVVFQSGSTYVSAGGGDPFGAAAPSSVVTFQTGSLYKHQTGTPSLSGRTYANFELDGSSATVSGTQALTVDDLSALGGNLQVQVATVHIRGNLNVTGGSLLFNRSSAQSIFLDGGSAQSVAAANAFASPNANLLIANPAGVTLQTPTAFGGGVTMNSGDLNLTSELQINPSGQLNLNNGRIHTGPGTVTLGAGVAVSGGNSSSYVDGNLSILINTSGSPQSPRFPVGDASTYAPVTILLPSVSASGDLLASTTPGDHASIGTSGLDAAKSVNRTWSIRTNTLVFAPCAATFTFAPGDVDAGADPSSFQVRKFDAPSTWSATTAGTRSATSTQALGIASFSDFQIGEAIPQYSITTTGGSGTFGAKHEFATGSSPFSVAIADFNGDLKPDLVAANTNAHSVSVLLGNGDGTFGSKTDFGTGNGPYSVAAGDLNGDGKLDVAVANHFSNTVSVLLGNGDGTLATASDYGTGAGPASVGIGDFNGDGKPDLAVANGNSSFVSVLLGNGDGTFGVKTDFTTGSGPVCVAIGDLNGDQKPDLVAANNGSGTVSVLLGVGDGTFGAHTDFAIGTNPTFAAIGDLNGDGKPDLAVTNGFFNVSVLNGAGDGTFGPATNFVTGNNPGSVVIEDLNGDAKPDLAVGANSNSLSVLLGAGDGTFGPKTDFGTGTDCLAVTAGDLNHDAVPDLVSANAISNDVSVLLGLGGSVAPPGATTALAGTSPAVTITAAVGFGIARVLVDGVSQGAVGSYTFTNIAASHKLDVAFRPLTEITASAGSGMFGAKTDFFTDSGPVSVGSVSVAIADLSGDGKLDLAVSNFYSNTVSVLLGNGDGTFAPETQFAVTGGSPHSVVIGEFNQDGRPDLAFATTSGASVLLGNGDGTFGPATVYAAGSIPWFISTADLNGDQKLDLVVANNNSATVSVLLGNGDGTFGPQTSYVTGSIPDGIGIADLNGDQKLDLAIACAGSTAVSVLLGNGDGTFGSNNDFGTGAGPVSVAVADLNHDGKLDLTTSNANAGTVSVLLGNGDGTFAANTDYSAGSRPFSVAIADLNGDGRPDLVAGNNSGNTLSVLLGKGDGTFEPNTDYATASGPYSVVIADFDGDGEPDLATANFYANSVSILRGAGGSIVPAGTTRVTMETNQSYTITAAPGFSIVDVFVDGVTQGAVTSYTFTNVVAKHTISASFAPTTLAVPPGVPVTFALEGARPNPTFGRDVRVVFDLPSEATARIELLDVGGRRVADREVGSLGAGHHVLSLAAGRKVSPGLYWVRLVQGRNQRITGVVVLD